MRTALLSLLVLFTLLSCGTQRKTPQPDITIYPFSDTVTITPSALIYSLPMTLFEIEVTLIRTIRLPGPYADFSAQLIGVTDIISDESEEWGIGAVELTGHTEIDPSEYYVLKADPLIYSNSLSLSHHGLIMSVSDPNVVRRRSLQPESDADYDLLNFTDLGSVEFSRVEEEIRYRLVDVDTAFIRVPYPVERREQLTREELAERAARTLLELREGRHLILIGETPLFPQSDAALAEIRRLEREYLSLFAGKTFQEQVRKRFYFTPDMQNINERTTLIFLSDERGPSTEVDSHGEPLSIEVIPAGKTLPLYHSEGMRVVTGNTPEGLTYRIPEVADVIIRSGEDLLLHTRSVVHQLGQKVVVPSSIMLQERGK